MGEEEGMGFCLMTEIGHILPIAGERAKKKKFKSKKKVD